MALHYCKVAVSDARCKHLTLQLYTLHIYHSFFFLRFKEEEGFGSKWLIPISAEECNDITIMCVSQCKYSRSGIHVCLTLESL